MTPHPKQQASSDIYLFPAPCGTGDLTCSPVRLLHDSDNPWGDVAISGELTFVRRLIAQSAELPHSCRWFTTLVSKSAHLPRLYQALKSVRAIDVKTIAMAQGQKRSRILAWTFLRHEGPS